MTMYDGQ